MHQLGQRRDRPRLHRRHCHDLLGEDVERIPRDPRRLDLASEHAIDDHGSLEQVAAVLGEDGALRRFADRMAGAADPLDAAATLVGDSTWMTRSTAPMSIPSSRLEVATSPGRRPALSASSIRRRCSLAIEPWWARTSSSPANPLIAAASRSASRRELTKMMVERC